MPVGEVPAVAAKPATAPNDISAEEVAGLLSQLRKMRDGLDSEARRASIEALKVLGPACASSTEAMNLWLASVRVVEFEKQNKRATDFEEWRKKNDEKLHDPAFSAALRLQCRYLKLCLEADTPEKAGRTGPAIIALVEEAIKAMPQCAQYAGLLSDDVFSSATAKKLGVEKLCPDGWPKALLNLGGHFGRFVKTAAMTNPADIPALWETRLKLERSHAEALDQNARVQRRRKNPELMGKRAGAQKEKDEQDTKHIDAFETEKLPALLWSLGEDCYKAGMRRRGIETFFGVLRKYPKHASASDWVDRVTKLAEEMEAGLNAPAQVTPADTATPATPANTGV